MATPPDTAGNPKSSAPPPPTNPDYRPPDYRPPDYRPQYDGSRNQQRNYPAPQQAPYYQGGYPAQPNYNPFEQPLMSYPAKEIIVVEEPYQPFARPVQQWERQPLQPGNVVYVDNDPYRRNDDDMWEDCLLGTCCASLLCCCCLAR